MKPGLASRFAQHLAGPRGVRGGETLVVGLSGGVDSVVLLHLLRFTPGLPSLTLVAAHVDHAMRPDSGGDARWVAGLCVAWDVPADVRRLAHAPTTEAEARAARYAVLEEVRAAHQAQRVLTAHHADDQAETVLFRVLRGSGLRGLQGIPERRGPALWRPLLPFTRDEIVTYAETMGLSWREDPSNAGGYARNVLRHQVLPLVEATVAPGARRALRGLARRARDDEAAWRSLEPGILAGLDAREEPDGYSLDRDRLLALHGAVRARVVRGLARRLGAGLDDAGTRLAVEFTSSGASGGMLSLGAGIRLGREFGRLVVVRSDTLPPDRPVTVPGPGNGKDRAVLGGRVYDVVWDVAWDVAGDVASAASADPLDRGESFDVEGIAFPLTVRNWRPGDRIRMAYGSKKLKKMFLEERIPVGDRPRIAVLVDASGAVLWVPGVARSVRGTPGDGTRIHIRVTHAESD